MHADLTITLKPFKSSKLAIPPSPFTPRLPITPPPSPPREGDSLDRAKQIRRLDLPPPPPEPLHWLWQCHICSRCYQLGVTRRCLDDGHYFCSGTTTVKRSKRNGNKKMVRHKACASEFDYQAWKVWANWRRSIFEQAEAAAALEQMLDCGEWPLFSTDAPNLGTFSKASRDAWHKDCWNNCDYPSECRWGKQFGVQSPAATTAVPSTPPKTPQVEPQASFEDVILNPDEEALLSHNVPELAHRTTVTALEEETKKPSMDDLLASAKRRKRRSVGFVASPLASNPPSPVPLESSSTAQALQKAFDDFELDFRKSFGRAGALVSNFVGNKCNSTVMEDQLEAFEKRSRYGRKKSAASFS